VSLGEGDVFAGGLTAGMFDADPSVSFNLELDQEQLGEDLSALTANLENLEESGLDTSSVNLEDGVHLDDVIDSSILSQLSSLDEELSLTLDVEGRGEEASATVSDDLAHELVESGIDFAHEDDLTVNVEGEGSFGTHLQTSLKELQKLGVDHIAILNDSGGSQIDVGLGEDEEFAGGLTAGMFDAEDTTVSFNLELDQEQLGDDLSALTANLENLEESGLDTSSVNLEDGVHLDDVIDSTILSQLSNLDGELSMTLDVEGRTEEGSATVSDGLAHNLVVAGVDFATADDLTVIADGDSATGTHLQTSLKELQKLGVDSVLLQGGTSVEGSVAWTVDLGSGSWDTRGQISALGDLDGNGFIDAAEDAAFDITLNIQSWSDLDVTDTELMEALVAAGIDHFDPLVSLENIVPQSGDWMGLPEINALHNVGLDYIQALLGSMNPLEPSSFEAAIAEEVDSLQMLGKLTELQSQNAAQALYGVDVLNQFTSPDKFGDLISALTNSGVADFVVEAGSVEITDPLAAALVDAGMLQALPQANMVIDATASGDHLFTSLKAMADLGIDQVNISVDKVYVDLGLPSNDIGAIEEIKSILAALDPANEAKPIFGVGHGALVLDNATAIEIHNAGGLDQAMIQALNNLGINEIDILAESLSAAQFDILSPTSQSQPVPVEVKVIGMAEDPVLHDYLQPQIPTK